MGQVCEIVSIPKGVKATDYPCVDILDESWRGGWSYAPIIAVNLARRRSVARRRRRSLSAPASKPGGQPNNGQISKILNDEHYTPQLDTFLKAVQGLGMTMREFLARMHQRLERTPVTGQGLRSAEDDFTLVVPRLEGPPMAISLKTLTEALEIVVARERRG